MRLRGGRERPRGFYADDLASGCGVTLAGLLHSGAEQLFDMFVCVHGSISSCRDTANPTPRAPRPQKDPHDCTEIARGPLSPLSPRCRRAWVSGQRVRREAPPKLEV